MIEQTLKEAKRLIELLLSDLDEVGMADESDLHIIECSAKLIKCGCECDLYNGFDCGCTQRAIMNESTMKEIEAIKSGNFMYVKQ